MERFEFDFDSRFLPLLRLWGVHPDNAYVELSDDDRLRARFGRAKISTPLSNISGLQITRNYHWFKAVGIRGSLKDHGLTFGTNARAGVCLCFHEPLRSLLFKNWFHHPGLTLTVEDPDGFAAVIRERAGLEEADA